MLPQVQFKTNIIQLLNADSWIRSIRIRPKCLNSIRQLGQHTNFLAYAIITIYTTYCGSTTGKEVLVLLVVKATQRVQDAKKSMVD
jgi:hypothetical protein